MATGMALRSGDAMNVFTLSFCFLWIGAVVSAANVRLLGYRLSLLPTVAFIAYTIMPMAVTSASLLFIPRWWILKDALVMFAAIWSFSAMRQLLESDPALESRRLLALYPFFIYSFLQAWFIIII